MKVSISYRDNESLSIEEVVRQAQQNYGNAVKVECMPESTMAYDLVYFGLQQLITHEQLSLLYDRGSNYQEDVRKLRQDVIYKIYEIVDQVIIDNEARVA